MPKLFGFPGEMPAGVPAFITWIAGPIELFGGMLVMVGLFTRPAAFLYIAARGAGPWSADAGRGAA